MIRGLRRSAGLELLSFAIQTNIGMGTFFDILQWFLTSLRDNKMQVAHYSDKIHGCGDSVLNAIRRQFFKVIKSVIVKAKETRDEKNLIMLLNALIWNYKGSDLSYLAECDIVGMLVKGDGGRMHPIAMSWGKQLKQKKESEDPTLTRTVITLFEYLFKQTLSQVVMFDSSKDEEEKAEKK